MIGNKGDVAGGEGGGGWGYTFLNSPCKFSIYDFTLRNSRENKLSPLEIPQNCVTPLGNSLVGWNSKTKTHGGNSTWIFLDHPWKFYFFFNWPLEFPHALFSIHLEIPCPQPPSPCFFSGIAAQSWSRSEDNDGYIASYARASYMIYIPISIDRYIICIAIILLNFKGWKHEIFLKLLKYK